MVLEKGSAIAGVIIKTQAANAQITTNMLARTRLRYYAAAAGYIISCRILPLSAKLAKANAVTAGALGKKRILKNNIGSAISIAKIAATTLQSRSAGSGGGGGGAAGDEGSRRKRPLTLI